MIEKKHLGFAFDDFFHLTFFLELCDVSTEKQQHAFESDNHVISGTASTEADSLAEGTQPILIKTIIVILSQTVLTEFPLAYILLV